MWDGVMHLVEQIKTCEKAGAIASALAMAYVCIDTMAYLALPAGREKQGRQDFIEWAAKLGQTVTLGVQGRYQVSGLRNGEDVIWSGSCALAR